MSEPRRDSVEYHNGRNARLAGDPLAAMPYAPRGDRAKRWTLGWREAIRLGSSSLVSGDALAPSSCDLIAQQAYLPVGARVPEGWRVLTGNATESLIGRLAYRYECEEESSR